MAETATPQASAAQLLEQHFDAAFAAPDGLKKLRELILTLAMQGKLVEQDPDEGTAQTLLTQIEAEKRRLVAAGKLKAHRPLPPIEADEVPYAVPEAWAWVRLGEISEYIQRGKGPKYSEEKSVPVVSQKCVQWRGFDKDVVKFIDPETLDAYKEERFLRVGDFLWNSTGTGTIGRVNLYDGELADFEHVVADSHVTVVRTVGIFKRYGLNFLLSPYIQDNIESSASGTTNQIELNTSTVERQLFALPPLPEQRRIVARIDQLMARCDDLEALRAAQQQQRLEVHAAALSRLLGATDAHAFVGAWQFVALHFGELHSTPHPVAELRKAVLQLAVMGKLVPQDPNEGTARELLVQIAEEKRRLVAAKKIKAPKPLPPMDPKDRPYEVPEGWEWVRLGMAGSFERGRSRHRPRNDRRLFEDGIYPLVQTGDVSRSKYTNSIIKTCTDYYNEIGLEQSRLWEAGTLCITIAANIAETGFLGMNACMPDSVVGFLGIDPALVKYTKVFIDVAKSDLENYAPSTAQKNINLEIINDLAFPLPPLPEQRRIVARIDQLMALCGALEEFLAAQTHIQSALLYSLMTSMTPATPVASRRVRLAPAQSDPDAARAEQAMPDSGQRRRGRPRKDGGIPIANNIENAVECIEALKLDRVQRSRQVSLFSEENQGE